MSLYHKHCPKDLDEVVGNEAAIEVIRKHFAQPPERWSHAWMISGPKGCGKNILADIIAHKFLNVSEFGFIENNTGSYRGIDAFREIQARVQSKPLGGGNWVVLVNEAQGLTKDARDSLLVPLEKAPSNVFYIFCSTSPQSLYKGEEGSAFESRLTKISVEPLQTKQMYRFLRGISKKEGKVMPDGVLQYIADISEGSPRMALSALDSVITLEDEEQMMRVVAIGPAMGEEPAVIDFCRALLSEGFKNSAEKLKLIKTIEPEKIRHGVLGYMSTVALSGGNRRAYKIMKAFSRNTYDNGFPGLVMATVEAFEE